MGLEISSGVGQVATLADDIVQRLFPDKTKAEQAQLAAAMEVIQGQLDANKAEAAQPGLHFRDGAGWVCVAGFAIATLKAPIEWGAALIGHPVTLPAVDVSVITPMLIALLGLGTMHTAQMMGKGK